MQIVSQKGPWYPAMEANMSRIAIVALITLLLAGGASSADIVYLLNGEAFEDVEAEVTQTQVRIHLPIGRINLSRSAVLRVEESSSLLGEFQSREDVLRQRDNSTAAEWVELARWAVRNGYEPGLKKATRVAARLDPRADGLAPLMRELRFEYDADLDRWIREVRSPQRHQSAAARQTAGAPEVQDREWQREQTRAEEAARRDAHIEKALDIIQEQVKKDDVPQQVVVPVQGTVLATGVGFFQTVPLAPSKTQAQAIQLQGSVFGASTLRLSATVRDLVNRIPGSFLPLR